MWFQRRLESLEYYIQDMKDKADKKPELEKLLQKIAKLKYRQPWNKGKKNLMLDEEALAQVKDVNSSGTETPYSHYVCFLSSAASQENTINQAFIVSGDNSLNISHASILGDQFPGLPSDQRELVENMIKKLNDSNISLTEKEKIYCDFIKRDPSDPNLLHVRLEDILNVSKLSNRSDSLSLDLGAKEPSKPSNKFNHKVILGGFKDTHADKVGSPLLSSIRALDSKKMNSFEIGLSIADKQDSLRLPPDGEFSNVLPKEDDGNEKSGDLDKAISHISVSEHQDNTEFKLNQEIISNQQSLQSLKNFLSSVRESKNTERQKEAPAAQPKVSARYKEEPKAEEISDLSIIEKAKDNSGKIEKFNASNSFLGDEDDGIKDFLENAPEEFNFNHSDPKLLPSIEDEPKRPKEKSAVPETKDKNGGVKNIFDPFSTENDKLLGDALVRKSSEVVPSQKKIINDTNVADISHNSSFFKKSGPVPALDLSKVREKRQKPNSIQALPNSNIINITIVDSSMNQSSMMIDPKYDDFEDDEAENKKTEKPSEKPQLLLEDKPSLQSQKTPVKFHNPRYLGEPENNSHSSRKKKSFIRNSVDFLPRPPSGPRHNGQVRANNLSLIDEIKINPGNTSFDGPSKPPPKKGHQLHASMVTMPGENPFDTSLIKNSIEYNSKKSSDYKNNRNSRSFAIQRNPEKDQHSTSVDSKPTRGAARALGMLIKDHQRHMTDLSPNTKLQDQLYMIKPSYTQQSFHTNQHSLQINYSSNYLNMSNSHNHDSNPPSRESTQVTKGLHQLALESSNKFGKKVLTVEDSKLYPTPQKPKRREFTRKIHNENHNQLNTTKDGDESFLGKGHKTLPKPASPIRKDKEDEKNKSMAQATNAPGHFRMKRFNIKKF